MERRIDTNKTFETSDLTLAGYLLTRGLTLWAVAPADPGRVRFVLTPKPRSEDLLEYSSGQASVEPQSYARALRQLKYALHHTGIER